METEHKERAEAAAHTAEHLFIRGLQNLGIELTVHVVEQEGFRGKVRLKADHLGWEEVVGSMVSTNSRIQEDLPVSEHSLESLARARAKFPGLRTRDERLSGSIRVVQIGEYDTATCAHTHAKSTREAGIFVVEDFHSISGSSYEIAFVTGAPAFELLGKRTLAAVEAARRLRGRHDSIAESATRAGAELSEFKEAVDELTRRLVAGLRPVESVAEIDVYSSDLGPVAAKPLLSEVGMGISEEKRVYLLGYSQAGVPSILLACSQGIALDCSRMLSEALLPWGGKGGGAANFAMGGGPSIKPMEVIDGLLDAVRTRLRENT
jgi:alanyl-tRNA synthetase